MARKRRHFYVVVSWRQYRSTTRRQRRQIWSFRAMKKDALEEFLRRDENDKKRRLLLFYFWAAKESYTGPQYDGELAERIPSLSLIQTLSLSLSLSLFYHFFSPVFAAELLSPNLTLPLPLSLLFQIPMWRFCLWVLASGLRLSQVQLAARPRRRQKFKDRWYFQECMWSVWKITRPVNPEAFTSPRATSLKVRLNWVCHTHLVS